MLENLYYYKAELIRCVDGDSAWFKLDRGFKDYSRKNIRLARIDAWELRGNPEEVTKGIAAAEYATEQYAKAKAIIIKSAKLDSFGRAIAEVYLEMPNLYEWRNLSDDLVLNGHAVYKKY